jgi:hypothetical protein
MYTSNVALSSETHASMTLSPSPNGYRFAADSLTVMLAASEFFDAARCYPIIFSNYGENQILPLALLGLETNENLFVDEEGAWDAPYIPAFIRRYPFIITEAVDGVMTVCFDESYDGFNLEGGDQLFENGEPSEKCRQIQEFLQDFHFRMEQNWGFCARLNELDLLHEITAHATLDDGRSFDLNGMLVVDEKKFNELTDDEVLTLFRSGELALIHAHLLSLRNLGILAARKTERGA